MTNDSDRPLQITVSAGLGQRRWWEACMPMAQGSTVGCALAQSGAIEQFAPSDQGLIRLSVWGKPAKIGQKLKNKDRVELVLPLRVDPKTARRERFDRQGSRGTGLFATLRPGAKKGY